MRSFQTIRYHLHLCLWVVVVTVLVMCSGLAGSEQHHAKPADIDILAAANSNVDKEWVTEKNGAYIPLDLSFIDENSEAVVLRDFIDRPTLILPIYFFCPNACSRNLANLAVALNRLNFEPGSDYRVIAVSFSHTENADNARRAKNNYMKLVYNEFPETQWKFLTGSKENIKLLTDALGYRFKRLDNETFLHPSTIIVVEGSGKIIRYVYGTFISGDIDMALANAQQGIPALSVKRFLDFCFNYDPQANSSVLQIVKIAVLSFFAVAVAIMFFYFGRRKKRTGQGQPNEQ